MWAWFSNVNHLGRWWKVLIKQKLTKKNNATKNYSVTIITLRRPKTKLEKATTYIFRTVDKFCYFIFVSAVTKILCL